MERIMFAVTSTGKNCPWARHCIYSVAAQSYDDWQHHYIAADRTTLAITKDALSHLPERSDYDAPITQLDYSEKTIVENVYTYWRLLPPEVVVVWLDGDDWLTGPHVLEQLAAVYREKAPWLTYGSFRCSISPPPFNMGNFGTRYGSVPPRQDHWRASHLKTFRAGLVQQMKEADLRRADGSWTEYVTDQVFMLPMLEMAGERYEVITDELMVYNIGNAMFHVNKQNQHKLDAEMAELRRIRALPPYQPLERRPF